MLEYVLAIYKILQKEKESRRDDEYVEPLVAAQMGRVHLKLLRELAADLPLRNGAVLIASKRIVKLRHAGRRGRRQRDEPRIRFAHGGVNVKSPRRRVDVYAVRAIGQPVQVLDFLPEDARIVISEPSDVGDGQHWHKRAISY